MRLFPLLLLFGLTGCGALIVPDLPKSAPPLIGMEEPARWLQEPQDEEARRDLAAGSFSGVVVGDARGSLEALLEAPPGLEVVEIVRNSPGQSAGLELGDLLLEVDAGAGPQLLEWPSDWRDLELAQPAGTTLRIVYDRAGVEFETELVLAERSQPAERDAARRFREEDRVGIVLRTATEVEARAAGLPPGGGAVVVGLDRLSPWRKAGLRFGDLLLAIEDQPVRDPQVVLEVVREADQDARLELELLRDGQHELLEVRLTRRAAQVREIYVPLLFSYEGDPEGSRTSVLLGLFSLRRTQAAWRVRLLWLVRFGGGDTDELVEVDG